MHYLYSEIPTITVNTNGTYGNTPVEKGRISHDFFEKRKWNNKEIIRLYS